MRTESNLMQFLADECHRLKSNLGELENDFNNEKMARRHWQSQCEQYQRELQLVKNHSVSGDHNRVCSFRSGLIAF